MNVVAPLIGILILTILTEGVVEYLGVTLPSKYKPYAAAVFAVAVCLGYGVDLPGAFGLHASYWWIGSIFTGLVIGRGSNYVNDLVSRIRVITGLGVPLSSVTDFTTAESLLPPGPALGPIQPASSTWSGPTRIPPTEARSIPPGKREP